MASQHSSALVHLGQGDIERCLDCLEATVDAELVVETLSAWMNVDPFWDPLCGSPRYRDILGRMRFPEEWKARRARH